MEVTRSGVQICAGPLGMLAIVPLLKLVRCTNNLQWRECAPAIWANATCGIASLCRDAEGVRSTAAQSVCASNICGVNLV